MPDMTISSRHSFLATTCSVALITGCATGTDRTADLQAPRVEPVYRVEQPAGTAAGQYAVGRMDLAAGRVEDAISRFRNALRLDPNFADARNGLGVAYGQQGRYDDAIAAFRATLASGPARAHVFSNLGYAQLRAGYLDDAWESLTRAFELDAWNKGTRANLRLLAERRQQRTQQATVLASAEPAAARPAATESTVAEPAAVSVDEPATGIAAPAAGAAGIDALPAGRAASAVADGSAASVDGAPPRAVVRPVTAPPVVEIVQRPGQATELVPVVVSVAQSLAADALAQPAVPATVMSGVAHPSGSSMLVQIEPNVYELRSASSTIAVAAADHAASTPAGAQVASPAGATAGTSGNVSDSTLAAVSGAARRVWKRAIRTIESIASSTARIAPEPAAGVRAVATDLPVHGRLEVSNAVGIKRLAAHTARQLGRYGVEVSRLSDYRPFGLPVTQIQYRDGHLTDARALQQHLPVTATMVPVASLREGVDLRLVVGRDMIAGRSAVPGVVVWWEQPSVPAPAPVRVAAGEAGGWRLL